ncbi:uncharacterized protein METZ01_LOCUS210286, partial [marine metagenome]
MKLHTNSKKKNIWRFISEVTRYLGLATILVVFHVQHALSEQLEFKRKKTDTGIQFYYEWIDGAKQQHNLRFEIPF